MSHSINFKRFFHSSQLTAYCKNLSSQSPTPSTTPKLKSNLGQTTQMPSLDVCPVKTKIARSKGDCRCVISSSHNIPEIVADNQVKRGDDCAQLIKPGKHYLGLETDIFVRMMLCWWLSNSIQTANPNRNAHRAPGLVSEPPETRQKTNVIIVDFIWFDQEKIVWVEIGRVEQMFTDDCDASIQFLDQLLFFKASCASFICEFCVWTWHVDFGSILFG